METISQPDHLPSKTRRKTGTRSHVDPRVPVDVSLDVQRLLKGKGKTVPDAKEQFLAWTEHVEMFEIRALWKRAIRVWTAWAWGVWLMTVAAAWDEFLGEEKMRAIYRLIAAHQRIGGVGKDDGEGAGENLAEDGRLFPKAPVFC